MTATGYAKDVLVNADWAKAHLDDPNVRFVEVDVDTTAYEQSHIPGAVGWNWTSQLTDGIRRDIASREDLSALLGESGIGPDTHDRPLRRQQQLVRRLGLLAAQDVRPPERHASSTAAASTGSTRPAADDRRPGLPGDQLPACRARPVAARLPRRRPAAPRRRRAGAGRRPLAGRVQRRDHRAARHDRDGPARRPHPGRRHIPWAQAVNEDGTFKSRRRAPRALRGKGVTPATRTSSRTAGSASARQPLLVRAPRAARLPEVRNYDGSWTEWGSCRRADREDRARSAELEKHDAGARPGTPDDRTRFCSRVADLVPPLPAPHAGSARRLSPAARRFMSPAKSEGDASPRIRPFPRGTNPGQREHRPRPVHPMGADRGRRRALQAARRAPCPVRSARRDRRARRHHVLPHRRAQLALVFVLRELLEFPRVRNYDGSWTEWGSMVGVPIERASAVPAAIAAAA